MSAAAIFAAGLAAMLVTGLVRDAPAAPWRARRAARERAELAAWAAYRAAFYSTGPAPRPTRAGRARRPSRRGPRTWLVVDPVE